MGRSCLQSHILKGVPAKLVLQTPKMQAPFGAKEWESNDPQKPSKWDLVLSFKGAGGQMQAFQELLRAVDEANVTHAFENQDTFFGEKNKAREIIQDRYTSLLNATNQKYEPKLTTKLDVKNGQYSGRVFDNQSVEQDLKFLDRGSYVQALIEFGPLWVVDKRFGQTVRTIQMMVHRQEQIRELAIVPMADEDDAQAVQDDGITFNDDSYVAYG